MKLLLLYFTIFLTIFWGNTQIGMNNWRVHFSTASTNGIANSTNKVYMSTANGLSTYDVEDNSIGSLTITNGLSDLNISAIADNNDIVVVGYVNGNVDIIKNNIITNVPWIKRAQISGSKTINNFYFYDNKIYICSNIGIVVYDLIKNEIKDTYYPANNIALNDITVFNDSFYVATNVGIYKASINEQFLNDANNWYKKTDLPFYINSSKVSKIETFKNQLFFVYDSDLFQDDSLYYLSTNNQLTNFYNGIAVSINDLKSETDEFLVTKYSTLEVFDKNLNSTNIIYDYTFGVAPKMTSSLKFNNEYWIADKNNGLIKAQSTWVNKHVSLNTPFSDNCYRLDIQYGKVFVAGGGLTQNLHNNYFRNGAYLFEKEEWTNFNSNTQSEINDANMWDVVSVAINPKNTNQMAMGSYSQAGLKIINNNIIDATYTAVNSPIEYQQGNGNTIIISDMHYDQEGNLWIVNAGVEPLKMLSADGIWYSFNLGLNAKNNYPYRLMIDSKGNKWVAFIGGGIVVFNDNGTYADKSDDKFVNITTAEGYGSLPSATVKAITEDIDGEIWIGTETGLVVIYNTENLFDGNYGDADANEILLKYGEEVEVLLGTTSITSITVDGGNRKWIGTSSSGVFCLSPNGTEEIYHFDTDNSPILTNEILDIRIDHLSGEVYMATESGLISYRADASIADNDFETIKVFPNPVRPNFGGNISIQGLGYESDVKITDVSGNLIYKTVSNGGTVIWNGKNLDGVRVQSGVYLVWTGITTGKGKNVAKILFIN